jgi:hypothetical protein
LADLLELVLAPGGKAFLSYQERPFALGFFRLLPGRFTMRSTRRKLRSGGESLTVHLHALALETGFSAGPGPSPGRAAS